MSDLGEKILVSLLSSVGFALLFHLVRDRLEAYRRRSILLRALISEGFATSRLTEGLLAGLRQSLSAIERLPKLGAFEADVLCDVKNGWVFHRPAIDVGGAMHVLHGPEVLCLLRFADRWARAYEFERRYRSEYVSMLTTCDGEHAASCEYRQQVLDSLKELIDLTEDLHVLGYEIGALYADRSPVADLNLAETYVAATGGGWDTPHLVQRRAGELRQQFKAAKRPKV